jgi:hypothetical protein
MMIQESDQKLYRPALESLRSQIRASTTSMTSVPKPLKFLRPHYDTIKAAHEKIKDKETKVICMQIDNNNTRFDTRCISSRYEDSKRSEISLLPNTETTHNNYLFHTHSTETQGTMTSHYFGQEGEIVNLF